MRGIMNHMTDSGGTTAHIIPIINLARVFEHDSDFNKNYSEDDNYHEYDTHAMVQTVYSTIDPEPPPPPEILYQPPTHKQQQRVEDALHSVNVDIDCV